MAKWHRVRSRAQDRGAAAVEFALVVPLLLLLFVGIVDYGRYFFDSVSLRQGAREAARQAVVEQYGSCPGATTGDKIACAARRASDITMGTPPVVAIRIPGGWVQGQQLIVCMASLAQPTGLVPFPATPIIKTKTIMSIEKVSAGVTGLPYSETELSGGEWNTWCP